MSGSGLCLLGCREGRRGEGSCQVDLPGQTSYTEHGESSRNHGGGRDAEPVEKQAAAKYKVVWKCSKKAGKKKIISNKKKKCSKTREKKRYNNIKIYLKKKVIRSLMDCKRFLGGKRNDK